MNRRAADSCIRSECKRRMQIRDRDIHRMESVIVTGFELRAIIFTGVLLSPVINSQNQYFCRYERINLSSTFLYVQTNQNGLT